MASYNDTHSDPSIYIPNLQIDTKKYTKSNSVHGLYKYSHYNIDYLPQLDEFAKIHAPTCILAMGSGARWLDGDRGKL